MSINQMNASRNRPAGSLRSATSTPGRVIAIRYAVKTIMIRFLTCLLLTSSLGCGQQPTPPKAVVMPSDAVLQEIHDLCAERNRLQIYHDADHSRLAEIEHRLTHIHNNELRSFQTVAKDAGLECSEEPLYGQPSYGVILYATAADDISANELLLFHADRVYRSSFYRKLNTTGEGWYFRPNVDIPKGQRFVVACIQDAPEEIENVKKGFMPNSARARDPSRPYLAQIFHRNGQPL